jgi:hypothetical protein
MLSTREIQRGKTELNGDTTAFFFLKPIRINACDRFDETRFAVIDVTGRPQDDLFHVIHVPYLNGEHDPTIMNWTIDNIYFRFFSN